MNGYQCETHDVLTDDGYIVIAHRIVTGINGPPVILQHGFLEASDNFLLLKENSLAFLLAEAGYDVWMTNFRGNYYSRGHVKYDRSMTSYWNFSFHECGYYDIPAFIDKIILVTGYPQVFYIGHSMGTTAFIVMASSRPEYNAKIRAALLMAQVVITPSLNELSFPMKMVIKYATTFCVSIFLVITLII
ncbi:hypothetical protein O3M35_010609 [Rhynocoris fuscipes]|uniref:AB hydrolase-1 domain-containing protein n=1 Tax=Rhynocoris fuscipes TaxID=488301 RepID=A0AAW1CZK7_9HEMI